MGMLQNCEFESILLESLMYEMKAVIISLLELPDEIKQLNVDVIDGSGYRFPDRINPIHEGFGLYDAASFEAVDAFCAQLDATPQQRSGTRPRPKARTRIQQLATWVWSNGRFHNVKHRVFSKQAGIRITIATFLLGPKEEVVEAPSELVTSDNPRHYVRFKFEYYWKSKMYKCFDGGEALNPFRIES
ncbi:hypothetical protein BUALT_Bualt07G0009200 [Buddleja alternifolia]|uniref:Isopenicillin N synthase-like Fe(2+) 2OG dioxygenase domain-containing protein n=1 Tax=Buddleja alternifolia TaxID=168488 RepID=A0AAV6XHT0_9LAMI|nr:hypothetical protein BUALT_Bualt07G0009200 [Buddleja alternifolia]